MVQFFRKKLPKWVVKLKKKDFSCSKSWIERFKKRHCITAGKIVGESASVDMNVVSDWFNTVWPDFRNNYDSKDIFNADETGLFYKLTPDKTLKYKGENCSGGKMSKVRITVLVAANMCGTEKRKLFVIGKSANPRCFKNKILPVKYRSNSKSWMTSNLFIEELLQWDAELQKKTEKFYFYWIIAQRILMFPLTKLNCFLCRLIPAQGCNPWIKG